MLQQAGEFFSFCKQTIFAVEYETTYVRVNIKQQSTRVKDCGLVQLNVENESRFGLQI